MSKKRSYKTIGPTFDYIDELVDRSVWLLGSRGRRYKEPPDGREFIDWVIQDIFIIKDIEKDTLSIGLKADGPHTLVYSGPVVDRNRAYIHVTGVKSAVEILRKHMVLDDLARVADANRT